jgi:ankyrin repeat protein
LVIIDAAAIGLFFVLGLAAAGPSRTNPLTVAAFFAVPGLILVGAIILFLIRDSVVTRGLAILIAAAPAILVIAGNRAAEFELRGYQDAGGAMHLFKQGPLRDVEAAIAKDDAGAVAASARKADLRTVGRTGVTVLRMALQKRPASLAVVQALLDAGADANAQGALEEAIYAGPDVTAVLLKAGADPNRRGEFGDPAYFAATGYRATPEILGLLRDHKANFNLAGTSGLTALIHARNTQNWAVVQFLVENGADWRNARTLQGESLAEALEQDLRKDFTKNKEQLAAILKQLRAQAP